MSIKRVVTNIKADELEPYRQFYEDVLGFTLVMNLGWIATFASPTNSNAQISVIYGQDPSGLHPDLTVEVEDVDRIYRTAITQQVKIAYPLTVEPWGVQRFFIVAPNGQVLNIVSHQP